MNAARTSGVRPIGLARVLLVDDNEDCRAVLSELLMGMGYPVVTAEDGLDALQRLERAVPDVIVLDWMMPRMNGAATLVALQADPRLASIPVIVASAVADVVPATGTAAVIMKPFDMVDLAAMIDAVTQRPARAAVA